MDKSKLRSISEKLDAILYLMEVSLPSWLCLGEIMNGLYGISDSLKEVLNDEE